jgi:NAD(P)-dependent dehydrogenase (short-subunit alcohol dehydrogenase family)
MADLRDRAIVVTGASSGLGRAISVELARRGARVVLAARRVDALEETARLCRDAGAEAIIVETDVTAEAAVQALADRCIEAFGRLDIWINNAGVTLFSPLEEAPFEEHRRVIETNLFGAMHGARAAIPIFRRQHAGILINIGSVLSFVGHAFVPSYVISKFGMTGLTETLRVELADEPDIHVCTVSPFSIDTPHFESAANRMGRAPRALPPMQSPEHVARVVADVCERPRRIRYVPRSVALGILLHALVPRATERVLFEALAKYHLGDAEQLAEGNLYEPEAGTGDTHGERPPTISTWRFFGWAAGRFVAATASEAMHGVRRWWARRTRALHAGAV